MPPTQGGASSRSLRPTNKDIEKIKSRIVTLSIKNQTAAHPQAISQKPDAC